MIEGDPYVIEEDPYVVDGDLSEEPNIEDDPDVVYEEPDIEEDPDVVDEEGTSQGKGPRCGRWYHPSVALPVLYFI